jgi:hypothetical protein
LGNGTATYWTSLNIDGVEWTVDFNAGNVSIGNIEETGYTRCIVDGALEAAYSETPNGITVKASHTELEWMIDPPGDIFDWKGALQYCNDLVLDDLGDWRLPNAKELQSIIQSSSSTGVLLPDSLMAPAPVFVYWSSSPDVLLTNGAWTVDFIDGIAMSFPMTDLYAVRCVREIQ